MKYFLIQYTENTDDTTSRMGGGEKQDDKTS